jgi:hypothetical protein
VAPTPTAQVAFSAKITDANGKILASKLFDVHRAAASADTVPAVMAINQAFASAATDLVAWTADALAGEPEPATSGEAQPPAEPAAPPPAGEAKAPDAPAEPATPPASNEASAPNAPADPAAPVAR